MVRNSLQTKKYQHRVRSVRVYGRLRFRFIGGFAPCPHVDGPGARHPQTFCQPPRHHRDSYKVIGCKKKKSTNERYLLGKCGFPQYYSVYQDFRTVLASGIFLLGFIHSFWIFPIGNLDCHCQTPLARSRWTSVRARSVFFTGRFCDAFGDGGAVLAGKSSLNLTSNLTRVRDRLHLPAAGDVGRQFRRPKSGSVVRGDETGPVVEDHWTHRAARSVAARREPEPLDEKTGADFEARSAGFAARPRPGRYVSLRPPSHREWSPDGPCNYVVRNRPPTIRQHAYFGSAKPPGKCLKWCAEQWGGLSTDG